ncbi:MAG TPA: DNRLRE domain-containing protein [Bacteroidales bacterium]|nr:DNRLRE domain-containing protein [Bacteroidales bacterium]
MKTMSRILLTASLFLPAMIFFSCEKNTVENAGTGEAAFSVNTAEIMSAKSAGADVLNAMQVMVSVEDIKGNKIFTDKLIPLYAFGTGFLSENIQVPSGDFRLTKFLVIDANGNVLYATPIMGSAMSYLIKSPLPVPFHIETEKVTNIAPEVLLVKDTSPDKFGYASFGYQVVKPLSFFTYCIIDNPLAASPTTITSAQLTVTAPDGWHYTFKLAQMVNNVIIRGGYATYDFVVSKDGYLPQKYQFTADQLAAATETNPLILKIPFSAQYQSLVLQPGPEMAKDAMISNLEPDKNFGDHKYFEATFLSEQMLTVMRSNRSLIHFNTEALPASAIIRKVVLTLWYDVPIPFDNSFMYLVNTLPGPGIAWYGAVFQRIVEPWDEYKVTWNNQPKTTEAGQVFLAPFIKNANVVELDVTKLFVSPTATTDVSVVTPNYGILFKLWPAEKFPGFRFASGDYPVPEMRPRLRIYYAVN